MSFTTPSLIKIQSPASSRKVKMSALEPSKTALVYIEFQNDFTSPGGVLHDAVKPCMEHVGLRVNAKAALEAARKAGIVIMHCPIHFAEGFNEIDKSKYGIMSGVVASNAFIKGKWGSEIDKEFTPKSNEILIEGKRGFDAFSSTNLDYILRSKKIENVILGGFLSNCCVESTMRTAYDRGYDVYTLIDCVSATSIDEHEATIKYNYGMFSKPVTSKDLIASLEKKIPLTSDSATRGGY